MPCTRLLAWPDRSRVRGPWSVWHQLRHSNISRMRAAGISADVVAAWHGHTERMTQAVYGRVTDDRLTAASAVFSAAVGQS
jgi:integrase